MDRWDRVRGCSGSPRRPRPRAVRLASVFVPGRRDVLHTAPLTFTTWVTLLGITLSSILLAEAYRSQRGPSLAERDHAGPPPARTGG